MFIKFLNIIVTNLLILTIRIYQLTLSPFLKSNCRYLPSCSEYSIAALKEYGLIVGLFYSAKRILSCHPFGGHGYDPVPKKFTKDS